MDKFLIGVDSWNIKKINTSGYQPQTDGLVEKFNSTRVSLIAKCCEAKCHDRDEHLPALLLLHYFMLKSGC